MLKRLALFLSLALMPLAHSQSADISVGGGMNTLGAGGAHATFVASGSALLGRYFSIGGEYAYQDAGSEQTYLGSYGAGYLTDQDNEHLQNYGAIWRAGFPHRRPAQSYLLVGGGGLHVTDHITILSTSNAGLPLGTATATASSNGVYFAAGGGVHIPIHNSSYGVRPEFRYERQMLPSYDAGGYTAPASHLNQILLTVSLYRTFGH